MTFSVIVPVYNVEKYLRQCLDSLVHQTFKDFEVIVVDDGSTDFSGMICDEYARNYEFVQVIHQINSGLSEARNKGMSVAKGRWLVFVDSDDWVETAMLERLSLYMLSSHADLYRFNVQKTDIKGNQTEKLLFTVENDMVSFNGEVSKFQFCFHKFLQYQTGWEVWGGIYKRDIVQWHQIHFSNTKKVFAEDLLFTYQYLLYVRNMAQVCDVFYNYRNRNSSLVNSASEESIIPRICALGETIYQKICEEDMKYFKKNYYKLYFMLLNYHIGYKLANITDEKMRQILEDMNTHRLHRRFMKALHRHKAELAPYMTKRVWV